MVKLQVAILLQLLASHFTLAERFRDKDLERVLNQEELDPDIHLLLLASHFTLGEQFRDMDLEERVLSQVELESDIHLLLLANRITLAVKPLDMALEGLEADIRLLLLANLITLEDKLRDMDQEFLEDQEQVFGIHLQLLVNHIIQTVSYNLELRELPEPDIPLPLQVNLTIPLLEEVDQSAQSAPIKLLTG